MASKVSNDRTSKNEAALISKQEENMKNPVDKKLEQNV